MPVLTILMGHVTQARIFFSTMNIRSMYLFNLHCYGTFELSIHQIIVSQSRPTDSDCEHAGILGQGNIILESLGSSIRYRWGGSPVHVSSVTGDINTKTAADVNFRASHDRSRGLYCLTNTHYVSSSGWDPITFTWAHESELYLQIRLLFM